MPSLYELSSDLERVIDGGMIVDMDTGEVLFDEENLDQLKATVAEKFLACKMFADGQRSKAQSLKDLAKAMTESAKAMEKKAERIEAYMLDRAKANGGEISTDSITVKVRKCPPSVEITDEEAIPKRFWREKVTRTIDKTRIKEELKSGEYVPGAALVVNEKVSVR